MIGSEGRLRRIATAMALFLVLLLTPVFAAAGEFKISRYIEPNQMSNLLTRHVRKGIIKRIGLTKLQLYEIREAIDPHREALLDQITHLKDARIELIETLAGEPFEPDLVRSAHAEALSRELDLMMTFGAVINDIRPILSEDQVREVHEMVEEVRVSSEIRFEDFAAKLASGELLGLEARVDTTE